MSTVKHTSDVGLMPHKVLGSTLTESGQIADAEAGRVIFHLAKQGVAGPMQNGTNRPSLMVMVEYRVLALPSGDRALADSAPAVLANEHLLPDHLKL